MPWSKCHGAKDQCHGAKDREVHPGSKEQCAVADVAGAARFESQRVGKQLHHLARNNPTALEKCEQQNRHQIKLFEDIGHKCGQIVEQIELLRGLSGHYECRESCNDTGGMVPTPAPQSNSGSSAIPIVPQTEQSDPGLQAHQTAVMPQTPFNGSIKTEPNGGTETEPNHA